MSVTWAYLYEHPGTDPDLDRTEIDRAGQRTILVPVADQGPPQDSPPPWPRRGSA